MFKGTLKEVSLDDNKEIYLLDDEKQEHRIFNFDGISKAFCRKLRGEKNSSCDGYYIKPDGNAFLVEFKNQPEGNIDKISLKNKIYDSITTLVMNENITRNEVVKRTSVIVVYNDSANQQKSKTSYNTSQAFNSFAKKIAELSEKKGIHSYDKKFGLQCYKDILFHDVFTVDKQIFEQEFMEFLFED